MLKKQFKSVLFWFLLALISYTCLTVHHYTEHENFDWKGFYQISSLFLRGFLLSSVFYFLVVYLPSKRKRSILKNNFKELYKNIKHDLIREILWCSQKGGRTDINATEELVDKLHNVREFRELFSHGKESNEGWYAFCNHIQGDPNDFLSLVQKLKLLAKQLDFILHNYEIKKQEQFDFFKRLEIIIIKLDYIDKNAPGDEVKMFSRFLWEMFAGWNFAEGYKDYDPIEKMIDEI